MKIKGRILRFTHNWFPLKLFFKCVQRLPFFKIIQENKSLTKSYEDHFIDKFKLLLNKKTQVAKPPKVVGS